MKLVPARRFIPDLHFPLAWGGGLIILSSWFLTTTARAIAPAYISDEKLAAHPVIVEAKWEKAPFRENHRSETRDGEKVITGIEAYTSLNVLRVIKGDIKPGIHPLMAGMGISWDKDGKYVSSGTSTEIMGDAGNITAPHLWFLTTAKSWDPADQREYLKVSNYREVQQMAFEDFYKAIGSPEPDQLIASLLSTAKDPVTYRTLLYVNGGRLPWPFDPKLDSDYMQSSGGDAKRKYAGAVAEAVKRKEPGHRRDLAVAVYDSMEGSNSIPLLRELLSNSDGAVRSVAAGLLARHKDTVSIPGINLAITGMEKGTMACRLIEALTAWQDARLVPAMASFLENGNSDCRIGDDLGLPCLAARDALHRITGHWFPFQVTPSLNAWKTAAAITDPNARRLELEKTLASDPNPLAARLKAGGRNGECTVTNKSPQPVVITRLPDDVDVRWKAGAGSGLSGAKTTDKNPSATEKFILLQPGKSIVFQIALSEEFLSSSPGNREIKLIYGTLATNMDHPGWIGLVEAREKQ